MTVAFSGAVSVCLDSRTSPPTPGAGQKAAKKLLDKYGADLKGAFAPNLISATGLLHALREAGLAGKVVLVGFDASVEHIDALRKGDMQGFVVQQPFMMGYTGVRTAVAALQGKTVEKEVYTETKLVTKENLDTPEIQQLLK